MFRGCVSFYIILFSSVIGFFSSRCAVSQTTQKQSFNELDPPEFYIQMNLKENEVLIDVRTAREFQKERIPNAILASHSTALFSVTDTLDLEQPLFIYCEDEARSITACNLLADRGFKNVYMLKEGIIGWKKRDLEIDQTRIKRKKQKESGNNQGAGNRVSLNICARNDQ